MGYTPEDVAKVNERLFAPYENQPLRRTDIAVLMGGRSTSGAVAREAAALYQQGAFGWAVVNGGARIRQPEVALGLALDGRFSALRENCRDIFTKAAEADYMRGVLQAQADVYIHEGSRARQADKIARDIVTEDHLKRGDSAAVIAYAPYLRRAIGSLRQAGVTMPLVGVPVYPFGLSPKNWQDSTLSKLVFKEAANMDPANPKGYVGTYTTAVDIEAEEAMNADLRVIAP